MLNNIKMNVIQTAANGIVNHETHFYFQQDGNNVKAHYSGGKIKQGYLVGTVQKATLTFTYCQLRIDGTQDHGESTCKISLNEANNKLQLVEEFAMQTNNVTELGVNIFQEV